MSGDLLRVEDLGVSFFPRNAEVPAVRRVSFALDPGASLGLVGESGCGKTVTALSIMGLISPPGRVVRGSISLGGRELTGLAAQEIRAVRGREIGMVFQEPMTHLNPVFSVGYQLAEALTTHFDLPRKDVRLRCLELLREVGVSAPETRINAYPAQLSGGLRQRAMIAMAVACRPKLVIADEPTTALDVTIQAQIMALLNRLRRELDMALLLITHDLGVVAQNVERVLVMYAGYVVEEAATGAIFKRPLHPYTQGLMESLPGVSGVRRGERLKAIPGNVPHPLKVPVGCPFRDRCHLVIDACASGLPSLDEKEDGHRARCIRVESHV